MLLKGKVAVIYGAAGAVGSASARAFAREGATVYLAGRRLDPLVELAAEITDSGGKAFAAQLDALDNAAVERHLDEIVTQSGHLDISYNLIGTGDAQGAPLFEMNAEHFLLPIEIAMRSHFITATGAGRHMAKQKRGVLLALSVNVAKIPEANVGGFGVACSAIDSFYRFVAKEAGPVGVRTVVLRAGGAPDTPGVQTAWSLHAAEAGMTLAEFGAMRSTKTAMNWLPLLGDVADAAVLAASDLARTMTGTILNVTGGELYDS